MTIFERQMSKREDKAEWLSNIKIFKE